MSLKTGTVSGQRGDMEGLTHTPTLHTSAEPLPCQSFMKTSLTLDFRSCIVKYHLHNWPYQSITCCYLLDISFLEVTHFKDFNTCFILVLNNVYDITALVFL